MKQLNLRLVVVTIVSLFGIGSDGWTQDDAAAVAYAESGVADSELLETDINSEGIEASVAVGFDGLRTDDSITAISFRVKNTSSEFLSGRIEVEKIEWRRRQGILSMPIEVGQNSPRRFSMGVRLPYDGQLICRIVSGDKVLWQKTVLLQFGGRSSYENPLLVVSEKFQSKREDEDFGSGRQSIFRIEPWQLPDLEQVLSPVGGIFLSSDIDFGTLVDSQNEALARYVAHGGAIHFPQSEVKWAEKVLEFLPYDLSLNKEGTTLVGLGRLVAHSHGSVQNLVAVARADMEYRLNEPTNYAGYFWPFDDSWRYSSRYGQLKNGPRAIHSLNTVLMFFIAYLLAMMIFFLFRKAKRKAVVRMLVFTIGAGVLLSVSLGIYLSNRDGDLVWVSVTHAGEGGAVQTALITLSSAGSGSHRVEMGSEYALIDDEDILRLNRRGDELAGVEYQGELTSPSPRGGKDVDIAPLGSRRIHSRGPVGGVKSLEIDAVASREDQRGISTLQLSITNPNSFAILSPQVVINKPDRDAHFAIVLPNIPAGRTIEREFTVANRRDAQSMQYWIAQHYMPKNSKQRTTGYGPALDMWFQGGDRLTLVGRLTSSPDFQVSGDFVEYVSDHYFMQRLPIELPKAFGY